MAAIKEMQENYKGEFDIKAAAPMAGTYDLKGTSDYTLANDYLLYSPFAAFLGYAYDKYYGFNSLDKMFKSPYSSNMANYFDGSMSGDEIQQQLPLTQLDTIPVPVTITHELFNEEFLAQYRGDGEIEFKKALEENNLYDWKPDMKIRLYHCKNDPIVPYFNSQKAYESFLNNGSNSVKLVTLEDSDIENPTGSIHSDCALPSYKRAIVWFNSIKN
jgi:hypothetical protein